MAVYTVHEPLSRSGQVASDPVRFSFVRDGFYFWAFLLAPLWMLRHRLWLALILYLVTLAALQIGLSVFGATAGTRAIAVALLSLLVGLEAASLRRWTLARRGWRNVGLVVGDDVEAAERRFFDAWVRRHDPRAPAAAGAASTRTWVPSNGPDVVGLFPEPGARR
jgi:Protein of unknown function (DUF2628)